MTPVAPFRLPPLLRLALVALVVTGAAAAVVGVLRDPGRTWPNLLLDGVYVVGLGVGAMVFLATQRLSSARWSAGLRRVPEAWMLTLPAAAVLLLLPWLGRRWVFPWSRPGALAHAVGGKALYLQPPWVFARTVVVLAVWTGFAFLLRSASRRQDREPLAALTWHRRLDRRAAVFTPVFAVTFAIASYDWLISLEPTWFSTMYSIYAFAGTFVQGIAAVTLGVVLLGAGGELGEEAGEEQRRDLGKLLFAFSTLWAYIWICQYLLIWYANIPEEISHHLRRTTGPWTALFALNFLVNWVVPFAALLSARAKARRGRLLWVSALLLVGHWLDLYLLVMPSALPAPRLGALELLVAAGYAALFCLLAARALSAAPRVPVNDPVLAERRWARAHPAPQALETRGAES